jgi:hypothetical protein
MTALSECASAFPKAAEIWSGISHHYRASGRPEVTFCVATAEGGAAWQAEITTWLAPESAEGKWWRGCDVGTSSAAIFAVFCSERFRADAAQIGRGSTPGECADFGRCARLLALFPGWRAQLHRVAEAYPWTAWPWLVTRWDELETAAPAEQTRILREAAT